MSTDRLHSLLFIVGDYTAGVLTGAATAAVCRNPSRRARVGGHVRDRYFM
jgi:hypothetical protein